MMSEQQTGQRPFERPHDEGVPPPPRFLLGLTVGLFLYFIAVATAAYLIYRSQQRLIALMPLGVGAVGLLAVGSVIGAIIFRKSLPRLLWLWLLIGLFLLTIIGSLGGILIFQSSLLPEYQQIVVTQIPFMRVFLPRPRLAGCYPPPHRPKTATFLQRICWPHRCSCQPGRQPRHQRFWLNPVQHRH